MENQQVLGSTPYAESSLRNALTIFDHSSEVQAFGLGELILHQRRVGRDQACLLP